MSPGWPRNRAAALIAALDDLSLSIPRPVAEQLIKDRVSEVAASMGVSPATARGHLPDEAIAEMAQAIAESLAEEGPGVDLYEAARTSAVTTEDLGRVIAGLAEAALIGLVAAADLDQTRHQVGELARCLSTLGTITATSPATISGDQARIALPPGLLHRAARHLEAAAASAEQGVTPPDYEGPQEALARTLRVDATALRALASAGTPAHRADGSSPLRLV